MLLLISDGTECYYWFQIVRNVITDFRLYGMLLLWECVGSTL